LGNRKSVFWLSCNVTLHPNRADSSIFSGKLFPK
jgi:hypothetical protein